MAVRVPCSRMLFLHRSVLRDDRINVNVRVTTIRGQSSVMRRRGRSYNILCSEIGNASSSTVQCMLNMVAMQLYNMTVHRLGNRITSAKAVNYFVKQIPL